MENIIFALQIFGNIGIQLVFVTFILGTYDVYGSW